MQIWTHLKNHKNFDEAIVEENRDAQPMCSPLVSCTSSLGVHLSSTPNFTSGE